MKRLCLFLSAFALIPGLAACGDKGGKNVIKEELIYDAFPSEYCINDAVDVTEIKVKTTYDDGSTSLDPLDRRCVTGLDNVTSTVGIKTLTVKYNDIVDKIKIGVYYGDDAYTEQYRSQFHYSKYFGWLNDPNGLVYNARTGEYHMYYQDGRRMSSNPANMWSERNWGHAVSTDLVHWQEIPGYALYVENDGFGDIWSGACAVDEDNTSGLFNDDVAPEERIVAIYSVTRPQQQYCLAYSTDGGYTFTKYGGNPVIDNSVGQWGGGFRDCKIYRIKDEGAKNGGYWLLVTAGESPGLRLFTSDDLINWTFNSEVRDRDGNPIGTECPFMVSLPVDGDRTRTKYVLSPGGTGYYIGALERGQNGLVRFVCESDKIPMNGGKDYYATMDWYLGDSERVVFTSWISDYYYQTNEKDTPDRKWEGLMSVPYEASLVTDADGDIRLRLNPVEELNVLRAERLFSVEDITVDETESNILDPVKDNCFEINLDCNYSGGDSGRFGFRVRKGDGACVEIYYDAATSSLVVDQSTCKVANSVSSYKVKGNADGHVKLRVLVDVGAIDAIVNDGAGTISTLYFINNDNMDTEFFVKDCTVEVNELTIDHINSIYHKNKI